MRYINLHLHYITLHYILAWLTDHWCMMSLIEEDYLSIVELDCHFM